MAAVESMDDHVSVPSCVWLSGWVIGLGYQTELSERTEKIREISEIREIRDPYADIKAKSTTNTPSNRLQIMNQTYDITYHSHISLDISRKSARINHHQLA